jgi:hypothetical protein
MPTRSIRSTLPVRYETTREHSPKRLANCLCLKAQFSTRPSVMAPRAREMARPIACALCSASAIVQVLLEILTKRRRKGNRVAS